MNWTYEKRFDDGLSSGIYAGIGYWTRYRPLPGGRGLGVMEYDCGCRHSHVTQRDGAMLMSPSEPCDRHKVAFTKR